jgi:hypothetical protein
MSGTRALITSIGASVLLVAAAALSLLAVSAVFAFGGWSDPIAASGDQQALQLAVDTGAGDRAARTAYVLPARPRARSARAASTAGVAPHTGARAAAQAGITPQTNRRPKASITPPSVSQSETPAATPQTAPKKSAGDSVRTAGEGLSGKVQSTADALAQITDPLLPPVTAAAQKVLNVVAELLRRTTNGLGSTLDGVLPAQ